jgi:hypothetical protein
MTDCKKDFPRLGDDAGVSVEAAPIGLSDAEFAAVSEKYSELWERSRSPLIIGGMIQARRSPIVADVPSVKRGPKPPGA